MPDNLIQFEGGDVLAAAEPLTITGLLLPYNEVGRTNIGRFQVEAGTVAIPTDPSIVGLNLDHVRQDVVGRAMTLEAKPEGVFASIKFADTDEGRAAYADAIDPNGKRRKLSAEFGPAIIKAGKLVAGHAKLWGAALVEAGAFPSAQVLASDTTEEAPAPVTAAPTVEPAAATPEPPAAPAEETPTQGESTVTTTEVLAGAQAPAIVPNTLATPPALVTPRPVDVRHVFAAIATLKADPSNDEARQVLAALTDITISGTGALPTTDVLRPNWLGELYAGIPYEREYINLGNLGTAISAGGKKGFRVHRGTSDVPIASPAGIPNGGTWPGNKAEINSYGGFTETASSSLRRFALGHDIGREFYDLPGGAEVVEAFLKLVLEDHLYWSDTWALYDIVTAAGIPVAAGTYPTDYPSALGMLIQGILAVKARKADGRRDVPTYAIANEEAYSALVYAAGGAEHLPEFVNIAVSTNSNGTVDGNIQVVQGDTGISGTASVIVGAKRGIDFDELPGGPLIVNALELAKGGIDRAVHGYLQTFPVRDEAIVLIGTPEARANSTAYPLGRLIKASSVIYRVTVAGTTGGSAPTAPAVDATVTDGTATLLRLV